MTSRALLILAILAGGLTPALAQQRPAAPAAAATPTLISEHNSWRAFSHRGPQGRQCYAFAAPASSEPRDIQPNTNRRGATNVFITHRPGANARSEVSIIIGYAFRANSNATVEVVSAQGTRRFTLFTRDQGAWLQNAQEEAQLIAAMRSGRELVVRGTSQRGTNTVDRYPLAGISAALDAITAARTCPAT